MQVYDSLIVEDKNRISQNSLNFINKRLDTLQFELGNLEGGIKSFRTNNEVFDIEGQSKMYLDHMTEGSKAIMTQDVKISVVDYLINYISDKRNIYELVPVNLGVEEPALTAFVAEYNKLQLERQANLKTTTANNPLIVIMDINLEKLRRNIDVALHQVKDAYLISKKSLEQEQTQYQGKLKSLPGKSMELNGINRKQKIMEDLFSFLLQKRMETSISSASTVSNSKIVEPAISSGFSYSPNKQKIYTLYLMFGLVIPVGLIALTGIIAGQSG